MGPPSSPGTAVALAMREQGGMPAGATMVIDPWLMGVLSSPSSPSALALSPTIAPQRPVPHPVYTGSIFGKPNPTENVEEDSALPSTTNVGGFNFGPVSYKPSLLFEAFHRSGGASKLPLSHTPIRTPLHMPTTSTGAQAATKTAEALVGLIGAPLPGPSIFGRSLAIALPLPWGPSSALMDLCPRSPPTPLPHPPSPLLPTLLA
jgi:hypothetical protein